MDSARKTEYLDLSYSEVATHSPHHRPHFLLDHRDTASATDQPHDMASDSDSAVVPNPQPPHTCRRLRLRACTGLGVLAWLRSLRPFRGIVLDVRARAPYYASDWTDAWNYRVVPATTLIFFAKCVPSLQLLVFVLNGASLLLVLIWMTGNYDYGY